MWYGGDNAGDTVAIPLSPKTVKTAAITLSVSFFIRILPFLFADMKDVLGRNNKDKTIGSVGNYWINVVLSFVGLAAVIVIIIGGISYTKSMGDPGKAKRARDTIIYGVVGLVVALLAPPFDLHASL